MKKTNTIGLIAGLACLASITSASAAVYNFDFNYNPFILVSGSDDPLATTLVAGDSFNYTLKANGQWTTLYTQSYFPIFVLPIDPFASRVVNDTLTLKNNGVTVYTQSETYGECCGGIGPYTNENLTANLTFDEIDISAQMVSGPATTFTSDLFFSGAPEYQNYFNNQVIGFEALPIPASWILMLTGFVGLGFIAFRRRNKMALV